MIDEKRKPGRPITKSERKIVTSITVSRSALERGKLKAEKKKKSVSAMIEDYFMSER